MQLLLPVSFQPNQTFASLVNASQSGTVLVEQLKQSIATPDFASFFITGAQDTGKSHLLSACCNYAEQSRRTSILLPMEQLVESDPQACQGLEQINVICLDNMQAIANNHQWQIAIFNLFNQAMELGNTIVFSADNTPTELNFTLPDLVSRMQWASIYALKELSEEDKMTALQTHAHLMGFEMSSEVASFMVNRLPRNMSILISSLKVLAKQSLQQQRKVTIPFVKHCFDL